MSDPFSSPKMLMKWAMQGLEEINLEGKKFFTDENFKFARRIDPLTGVSEYAVVQHYEIPDTITRKVSEALNNIRHIFDQTTYAACMAIGRRIENAYYPWSNNPKDLEWRMIGKNAEKPRIPVEFHDVFRSLKPYPTGEGYEGGDDMARRLATLANKKHTVCINSSVKNEGFTFEGILPVDDIGSELFIPSDGWNKSKRELILARYKGTRVIGAPYKYSIEMNFVFDELSMQEDAKVVPTLNAFAYRAHEAIIALQGRVKELNSK